MRKSLKSYLWKAAVFFLLAVLIGLRPAEAYSDQVCSGVVDWTRTAIDWRLAGHPAHEAKSTGAETLTEEGKPYWHMIVNEVYSAPAERLTGPEKADWLTRLYYDCRELEGGEQL